jgi:hypothetical protein
MSNETKSILLDDAKVLLLFDNPHLKLPFEHFDISVGCREASWIWMLCLSILMPAPLPDIVDYILSWRSEDIIQRQVAVATTQRRLGTPPVPFACWP